MRKHYTAPLLMLLGILAGRGAQAGDLKDFYPSLAAQAETNVGVFLTGSLSGSSQFLSTFNSASALVQFSTQIADQFNYYPVGSTVAAFTYKFDPNMNIFERSTDGLGPLLSERGQTTGEGKLNVAFGYSWIDYDQFQGQNLGNYNLTSGGAPVIVISPSPNNTISGPAPSHPATEVPPPPPSVVFNTGLLPITKTPIHFVIPPCATPPCKAAGGFPASGAPGSYTLAASIPNVTLDTSIETDAYALFVNYGVTDKLDVGIVVPYLATWLKGSVQANGLIDPSTGRAFSVQTSGSAQSSGIGDLVLRAKMNLFDNEYGALASRLDFYIPTGDADNFQGFGHPAGGASLIYSTAFGIFSPHASVGFLWRFDAQQFNALRFALGGDVRITPWLTATSDLLLNQNTAQYNVGNTILSVATGFKVNPWRRLVLSTNLLWRLNDQGLRALVIPSVSAEYTFR